MDNKVICLDNEYDTYIEELFFKKVKTDIKSKITRNNIIAAWRLDKKIYTDYSGSISHEFLHYSLHDQSHSISILQYVYLLLGEELLNNFSVSDLWIMLEVAYSHDIGMAATYEELKRIWDDKIEINNVIKRILKYSDKEAMELYNTVNERIEHDLNNPADEVLHTYPHWQLEFRKAINFINAEYLRKNHSSKSKTIIDKVLLELNTKHLNIEERFYKIIGQINYLHGEDFCQIEKILENEELGLETDVFHPRMIAMLLRMGDVLDIRNNRFNLRDKEYLGGLPKDSKEHFLKHKGVTNFLVTNECVRVHIKSNDLNVCKNSAYWLEYIEHEYNNFTSHWNNYVSDNLKGLKLKNIDVGIEYKGKKFILQDFSKYLKTDPKKLMQLMVGENLYNTNLIMFREFLQNAIDASKVKLAMTYIDDKSFLEKSGIESFNKVSPKNFTAEDYDSLNIDVRFDYDEKSDQITFIIADRGIGMDEDGLDALCNIGQGWNQRREIANRFDEFPEWLRPIGGFGIGTLSTFLLSNQVQFKTKSKNNPHYDVKINSPINGGDGTIEKLIIDSEDKISGTEVIVKVDFNKYYYEIMRYFRNEKMEIKENLQYANIDNSNIKEQFIYESLNTLINNLIVNSFFSIKIASLNELYEKSFRRIDLNRQEDKNILNKKLKVKEGKTIWDESNGRIVKYKSIDNIIDQNNQIDSILFNISSEGTTSTFIYSDSKNKLNLAYKGINVNAHNMIREENEGLFFLLVGIIDNIDFYSDAATNVLDISRTSFNSNFNLEEKISNIMYDYLIDFIKEDNASNTSALKSIMEKYYIFFFDKIKINRKIVEKVKNQQYLFNKKYYYFDKNEFLEYKISECSYNIRKYILRFKNVSNSKTKYYRGDGDNSIVIKQLKQYTNELYGILQFYKDDYLRKIIKEFGNVLNSKESKELPMRKLDNTLKKYIKNYDNEKYAFAHFLDNSKIYVDSVNNYKDLDNDKIKQINSEKTLYYAEDDSGDIVSYKFFINNHLKSYRIDEEQLTLETHFALIKCEDKEHSENIVDVLLYDLLKRTNNKIYEVTNDKLNQEYNDLLISNYLDINGNKVILNPFADSIGIFVGDNAEYILVNNGFNKQKIINKLDKNEMFKKFVDNIYKYKLASTTNEKEKQKINREKIRKLYVSLICEVLEKYAIKNNK